MPTKTKLSNEARRLLAEYALQVASKKHPGAKINVWVGEYVEENGTVDRRVTVVSD